MATSNFIKICVKSDTTATESAEKALSATNLWETVSQEWANNPADGAAWEWSDIKGLQAGIALRRQEADGYGKCTQLYVEVDYTYTPPTPPAAPEYQKRQILGYDYTSGETRLVAVNVSGQIAIHAEISDIVQARISGQTVTVSSGHIHVVSGQVISKISGEAVKVSGATVIGKVSGEVVKISGEVVKISGQVVIAKISGETVIAKVSGEIVGITSPTEVKTGLIRRIIGGTAGSGGEVLLSGGGAVKAVQIKAITDSGVIAIGGVNNRPWYEARCSGLGFVLEDGEVKSFDIDNLDKVYVVAQTSGDQISWMGVN